LFVFKKVTEKKTAFAAKKRNHLPGERSLMSASY